MKRFGILGIAAAAVLTSCGGTTVGGGANGAVVATFSGAFTGSVSTVSASGTYEAGVSPVTVGFEVQGTPSVGFVLQFNSSTTSLSTGTYTQTTGSIAIVTATVSDTAVGTAVYEIGVGAASGRAVQGTFSLDITSTGTEVTANGATAWAGIHGTLVATFPNADTTKTDTVTMNANF